VVLPVRQKVPDYIRTCILVDLPETDVRQRGLLIKTLQALSEIVKTVYVPAGIYVQMMWKKSSITLQRKFGICFTIALYQEQRRSVIVASRDTS
jgi:hypothetical protein